MLVNNNINVFNVKQDFIEYKMENMYVFKVVMKMNFMMFKNKYLIKV